MNIIIYEDEIKNLIIEYLKDKLGLTVKQKEIHLNADFEGQNIEARVDLNKNY